MLRGFAYIVRVKFKNIKSKYLNNFISMSKCRHIRGATYDNGRIVKASELEMTLTDIDFKIIVESYSGTYEILESYYSLYKYLPEKFYKFILEKYVEKTKLKNVEGREVEYALSKNMFNSLYGMSVTNTIRDEVVFDNNTLWSENPLDNISILLKLQEEKQKGFLSFSWGVWVTAYARRNLIQNIIKLDKYVVYCDTDSIKVVQGYDKNIIESYNNEVKAKLEEVSKKLEIDFSSYAPEDVKGIPHLLGIFEHEKFSESDFTYKEFITQGAKKYAYKTFEDNVKITVSGVPKSGAKALNNDLHNFIDDLIFKYEDTGKNILQYNDNQDAIEVTDYLGNKEIVKEKSGACLIPTTYILKKSLEYSNFIDENSSSRSIYKE